MIALAQLAIFALIAAVLFGLWLREIRIAHRMADELERADALLAAMAARGRA